MATINQLSAVDAVTGGDNLPLYSPAQGDARRASLTTILAWISTAFTTVVASSYTKVSPVAFANLPSAVTAGAGARAFVTDSNTATFNATVAAGGANAVPVFSDGTDWKVG